MLLNLLFLFVLSTLMQIESTDIDSELLVHGIVGESVHLQCNVGDFRSIPRVYFQKWSGEEVFVNGFDRSDLTVSKDYVNRTVVNRTTLSMELRHLTLADEGVYKCIAFYEPKPEEILPRNTTMFYLKVTANYSVPKISIDRCSNGSTPHNSKICVVSCSSTGGFPLKNISWLVSEHKSSLLRENGDGVNVRDPVGVWNVSQSATLNCSQPVNISCSVGGAVSELLHMCLAAPSDSHNDWLVFVVCAVLLLITFIIAVVLIKRRRTQQPQAESAEMENLNRTSNGV